MYAPHNKGKGKGIKFLRDNLSYAGEECLIWPMFRDDHGYGIMGYCGKLYKASRMMCELVKGPPPSPEHHAAHSCGNGHLGCVHPKHLDWKTPEQNQWDAVEHGRVKPRGPRRKLTDEQVSEIRASTTPRYELAATYGVRVETIDRIRNGSARARPPKVTNRKFPPDVRARMVATAKRLRAAGQTYQSIADQIDVSRLTVRTMVHE